MAESPHDEPVSALFTVGVPDYLALKLSFFDCFKYFPFMEHEVLIFVIELVDFSLVVSNKCIEDSSAILLIVPFFIHKQIELVLALNIKFKEVRLLAEPFALFNSFFFIGLSLFLLVL